jgi:hypothetical protein
VILVPTSVGNGLFNGHGNGAYSGKTDNPLTARKIALITQFILRSFYFPILLNLAMLKKTLVCDLYLIVNIFNCNL